MCKTTYKGTDIYLSDAPAWRYEARVDTPDGGGQRVFGDTLADMRHLITRYQTGARS